jgi:hypothetical protein
MLLAHFLKPFLECRPETFVDTPDAYREAVHETRLFLSPLNPPRVELETAVLIVFKKRGFSPIQRPRRFPPQQGQGRGEQRKEGESRQDRSLGARSQAPARPAQEGSREGEGAQGESSSAKRRRRRKRHHAPQSGQKSGQGPSDAPL